MRCLAVVTLLLLVNAFQLPVAAAASAVEPDEQQQQRALLQDALSNSNGCLETIPKCETGACATRNVMGSARWVCLRCMANYQPVVDGSGQDNIIQCGECAALILMALSGMLGFVGQQQQCGAWTASDAEHPLMHHHALDIKFCCIHCLL